MRLSRVSTVLGVSASSLLLAGTGLGQAAAPASDGPATQQAPAAAPAKPYGTVTARSGVNAREYPSTNAAVRAVLKYRQQAGIDCKVNGQPIEGNRIWYKLRGSNLWVSARWFPNTGSVPWCKKNHPSTLTQQELKESRLAKG